jgi:ribosome modulation factor
MGTRQDIAQAIQQGQEAGRTGEPATVCPYGAADILRTAWIRGYAQTAPSPVQGDTAS